MRTLRRCFTLRGDWRGRRRRMPVRQRAEKNWLLAGLAHRAGAGAAKRKSGSPGIRHPGNGAFPSLSGLLSNFSRAAKGEKGKPPLGGEAAKAKKEFGREIPILLREAGNGIRFGVVNLEDGEQLGDLQHFLELAAEMAEAERSALRLGAVVRGHESAE